MGTRFTAPGSGAGGGRQGDGRKEKTLQTNNLTEDQQRLYQQVLAKVGGTGKTAEMVLLSSGATAEDQAAVADEFCPGAGKGYLR